MSHAVPNDKQTCTSFEFLKTCKFACEKCVKTLMWEVIAIVYEILDHNVSISFV